jgi:DNA-binding transcriptional LysR family regulator
MDPGRHVSLARLEGFYWVARTGGYAKAARAFPYPITQPAVHQQVKKLEGELGVVLFERVGKEQMQLSASGARLYEFVAPFFEGLPAVLRSVRGGDYAGVLRILSAPMFVRRLLPAWLERLRAERPGVEVELREMAPPDIGLLRRGEVDLLVDYLPEVPDEFASMRVGVVRPCLVVPAGHPAAAGELARLSGTTFVGYPRGLLPHELQNRALAELGIVPGGRITADSAESILSCVGRGLGFSIVPALAGQEPAAAEGVRVLPLELPETAYDVLAVWRKDTPDNPRLDAALSTAPVPDR